MRVVAPALCAALLVVGVTACSSNQMVAMSESSVAVVQAFEDALEQLPGVNDVKLAPEETGSQVHLTVAFDDDATTDQIEEAGVQASTLRQTDLPDGIYPGQIELRFGASVYAYFTLPTADALRGQLGYWSELARTGVSGVNVRTFTAPLSPPAPDSPMPASTTGAPVLMNAPTGRYVGITMPSGDPEATRPVFEAMRAVKDPGASVGEWHVVSEDARVKAEFAGPLLPAATDLDTAIALLSTVDGLGDDATLGLRVDRDGDGATYSAHLTAFDDGLDDARIETIQEEMRDTPIWDAVLLLVSTLDETGVDFNVSLLSNSLIDAGNFVFGVTVSGCSFEGDDSWPNLSAELAARWQTVHDARLPGMCAAA